MRDVHLCSAFPSHQAWSNKSRLVFNILCGKEKRLTIALTSLLSDESLLHILKRLFKSEY